MNDNKIKDIKKKLQKELESKRYEHTIGVADMAFSLALTYGCDAEKAYIAGLLHDCAKCYDDSKRNSLLKKYNVKLSDTEKANPSLIHSKLGYYVAKDKYDIDDEEILNAIKYHTTGKADMSLIEKIVFSADYIEPNRKQILGIDDIRNVIFKDLDKAVYLILLNSIKHLENKKLLIDNGSLEAIKYYEKYK